jgi:hypothetical protein
MQNNTERKQIGARILSAAENLFRAPIGRSSANGGIGLVAGKARHAEVGELDPIFVGDEDVGGLDVAVNDGAPMRDRKSRSYVAGPLTGGGIWNAAFGDDFFERLAFDHFHDQEGGLCRFLDAHVMDGDDVRMGKLGDNTRFAEKKVAGVAAGELRTEEFDGNGTVEEGIVAADYAAVGADAESFVNLIATDLHRYFSSVR